MEIAIDVITLEYDGNRTTIQYSFKENPTYHPQGVWNKKLDEKYGNEVSLETIKTMSENLFKQFRSTNKGVQKDRVDVNTQFDKETIEDLNNQLETLNEYKLQVETNEKEAFKYRIYACLLCTRSSDLPFFSLQLLRTQDFYELCYWLMGRILCYRILRLVRRSSLYER